ncbi:filamentous hemagglutinin N-terminal domain-containing protein [Sporomusa sp. KB1]|jgi:filamentous hemagglutinin family protein|uniref:two-partner secretion domain-containing protein n=1 Tax=Sporomusa sp. KB1 TaxID=943346 RepID=UPI0011A02C97|nr:filamentous hemagglutinin N-terminal domain-containing protein [Sporomusa sp. KB1]TWH51617.1 filamentous hemagglutinin family protein [Sporomusa sp. KB1]TWH52196.1 filamentous hemagglutinin family protein [Sporomusa sp. KB1]
MQRKWRRDWERSKPSQRQNSVSKSTPTINPLKILAKSILPSVMAAGILLGSMNGVFANPTGGTVTTGSGTISSSGTTTTITQTTDKLGINWQSFSIGSGETVNFIQPGTSSIALNRVIGNDASAIYGTLTANGKVFLINPNGILFAPGAKVDVGGLVASTLDLSDSDFQAGKYKFTGRDGTIGTVVNQGTITAANGGYVALLGPQVANEGIIVAQQGTVALGAGQAITLDMDGDGLLNLAVDKAAINASAANHNLIQADGGQVIMAASAAGDLAGTVVNNSGIIQAHSVSNVNGKIILDGGTNGTVVSSGTLDASGKNAGETGGTVKVLGNTVTLADGAKVNVSGAKGGGTALIGGNYQGKGTEQNATTTTVAATATINADALTSGDGGQVVVWANDTTNYYGTISAKGGSVSGNGGSAEVSGKQTLLYKGYTNLLAPNGTTGTLLLDPGEYTISTDATSGNVYNATDLANQLTSANITLQTDGTGTGNITVAAPVSWSSGNSLTLQADNDINVNANITNTGSGGVTLKADKDVNVNATITTGSGNVVLRSDSDADSSGTVAFGTDGKVVSGGTVSIYYNPTSYDDAATQSTAVTTWAGTTTSNPYTSYVTGDLTAYMLVNSLDDLQNVSNNLYGVYALGTDIDAGATSTWNSGAGFVPIGGTQSFGGIFDGDGHVISGLTINSNSSSAYIGLFSHTIYATIRNVGLENVNITGTWNNGGALVGSAAAYTTITNCYSTGTIKGIGSIAGGLVGNSEATTFTNSYSDVNISVNSSTSVTAGGLVGSMSSGGAITNSYSTGTVDVTATGNWTSVGGLVGSSGGTITNSYSTGALTLTDAAGFNFIGGLVGIDSSISTFNNCYTTSPVTMNGDSSYVGGFGGLVLGTITNSYSTGSITNNGSNTFGGFLGSNGSAFGLNATIAGSYWDTETSGISDTTKGVGDAANASGVTGLTTIQARDKTTLTNLGFDFTNTWFMIDGYTRPFLRSELYSSTISNAHQLQLIAATENLNDSYTLSRNLDLSGLFTDAAGMWNTATGFVPIGSATTPFTGSFDGNGYSISGLTITNPSVSAIGLFGYISGATISDVGLTGLVITGGANNTYVGGLVGYNDGGTIADVYTTGAVNGGTNAGGLVGFNNGTVKQSYSMATVSGAGNVGGLTGTNTGTITNSYFDAAGVVSGGTASKTGGIAGVNSGTISTSYSAGAVSGGTAGGLVGDGSGGTVAASVWDTTTSGQTSGVGSDSSATGVTGLTTAQMGNSANYPSGWDFTNTWSLSGARPLLQWELNGSTIITTLDQLLALSNNLSGTYILAADIDLTGTAWTPIGDSATTSFTGILKGNGYTISGLTITDSAASALGLFGYTKGASLSSINLTNVNIVAGANNLYVGSLVGYSGIGTSITGSSSAGKIIASGTGNTVGGLVGYNAGSIESSANTAAVTATGASSLVGGLAGWNAIDGVITGSNNAGMVTASGANSIVGGLTGTNAGTIESSYVDTAVTVTSDADSNSAGGLVGENDGSISSSYNKGGVKTTASATNNKVGGLAGVNNASSTITGSYNSGAITANGAASDVGGLIGTNNSNITSLYNAGAVTSTADNSIVGGLVGRNNSTISNSYNSARVTASGATSTAGGLVGINTSTGAITGSYDTSAVTVSGAASTAGGLVGENDGSITNSYSMIKTSGTGAGSTIGGLAGINNGTIATSFSVGATTGTDSTVGGLVGVNNGTITDAVWCTTTSGQTTGIGSGSGTATNVQGLMWANMLKSSNFSTWDTSKWGITNGFLPYLQWQYDGTPTQSFTGTVQGGTGETINVVFTNYSGITQTAAQAYEFGVDGFYYGMGTTSVPTNRAVLLYVAGDANYKANSIYRATSNGLTGSKLIKDTLFIDNSGATSDTDPSIWNVFTTYQSPDEILYTFGTLNGVSGLIVNGNLIANDISLGNSTNSIIATGSITITTPGDIMFNNNFHANNLDSFDLGNQQLVALGGDITITAGGNIILRHGATNTTELTASGDVTLVAGTGFLNDSGANAIVAGGRWLVYAPDQLIYSSNTALYYDARTYDKLSRMTSKVDSPSSELIYDARGGLTGDFVLWDGQSAPATGSGFIFTAANPLTRPLTPAQLQRNAAITEALISNARLGSIVTPAADLAVSSETLPFLTIVGEGVAIQ